MPAERRAAEPRQVNERLDSNGHCIPAVGSSGLFGAASVVVARLEKVDAASADQVDNTVLLRDAPRPCIGRHVAQGLRLALEEVPLTRHELYNADEAFLTSTLKEVLAVTWIDGRKIADGRPGPITQRLRRAFRQLVRRELHL